MTKAKIEKISVAITAEQHARIKAAVKSALRELELKEEMRRLDGERIAKLWDEGIARAGVCYYTPHGVTSC